jgi:hypothetical protein
MQGNLTKQIERKRIFDEAAKLGIKPEELKRAGISGY